MAFIPDGPVIPSVLSAAWQMEGPPTHYNRMGRTSGCCLSAKRTEDIVAADQGVCLSKMHCTIGRLAGYIYYHQEIEHHLCFCLRTDECLTSLCLQDIKATGAELASPVTSFTVTITLLMHECFSLSSFPDEGSCKLPKRWKTIAHFG